MRTDNERVWISLVLIVIHFPFITLVDLISLNFSHIYNYFVYILVCVYAGVLGPVIELYTKCLFPVLLCLVFRAFSVKEPHDLRRDFFFIKWKECSMAI